jgi:hypothetical protein
MAGDDTIGDGAAPPRGRQRPRLRSRRSWWAPAGGHRPRAGGETGAMTVSCGKPAEFRASAVQLIGEEAAEQAVAGTVVVR